MKVGKQTYVLDKPVYIGETYTIAGPFEGEGNYGQYFDLVLEDDLWECKSHEKTEIKMHKEAISYLLEKAEQEENEIDALFGGDLLDQIITTSFSAREFEIPFIGMYEACSTFGECLAVASMLISAGFMQKAICATSSHFGSAERQYRFPLELGTQSPPTAQWTVTGAGATYLTSEEKENCPRICSVTIGKIIDFGVNNVNNMGGAMAPAAYHTINQHLTDLGREANYYDMIITGDLGKFGIDLLHYIAGKDNIELGSVLNDCGALIYHNDQEVVQGGSGAGCSSLVFNSYFYKEMKKGSFKKILLVPTGALLSKLSSLQGETIPAVAHAIDIEM